MNKGKNNIRDLKNVYDYCNTSYIISESKPYPPSFGYEFFEEGIDKCYLFYKGFHIFSTKGLYPTLYRFLYLNEDNTYLNGLYDSMYQFAKYVTDDANFIVGVSFTEKEVRKTVDSAWNDYFDDKRNDTLKHGMLFTKKKFLFGLNPKTSDKYTHQEIMKIVNMRQTKYSDDMFLEAVEFLSESLDVKITYQDIANHIGCSLQTVRQKIPQKAKDIIKDHNEFILTTGRVQKIEELIGKLTNEGKNKASVRLIKEITKVRDYKLINRVLSKYDVK